MANIVDASVLDKELNPEQAAAAKKIDGPMLILAGAGSGKTRAITYKIAHLVSQYNVETDRILAVTFTNKAAREMRDRIQKLLDCDMNFRWMGTFHSVCLKLLKLCLSKESIASAVGEKWYNGNFSIYDDDDQRRLVKEILKDEIGETVEASDIKMLHSAISKYKNTIIYKNGIAVLQTPKIALERAEGPDQALYARCYAKYQERLKESNAMDFDDLLFNAVYLLQKVPKLAEQLAYRFRYVVVDEYQDTNDVQYELLKLLINKETKNVTVVGDDDQSIYGWRGANIQIIRDFHRDFAPVTIVKLERNYRSTSNIVKGAGSVIAHNARPIEMEKKVYSMEESGELIHVRLFLSDPAVERPRSLDKKEAFAIAENIAKAGPNNYSKTAIFYRTNAQSRVIEEALNKFRIPLVIFGGTKFWDRKEVKDILAYMRLLANDKDDAAFKRVINTPSRAIGQTTVENIIEREKKNGGSFWDNLLAESNGTSRGAPKLKNFTDKVLSWKEMANNKEFGLRNLVERIISDINYEDYLRKDDELTADERIGNINELKNAVADFEEKNVDVSLESFLQDIALLTDADKSVDASKGFVTLMTIHMAKGLEFNTVHIAGCNDGIFPLIRETETREQIEEERRLFYVGCTRAERILYLYYAECRFYQGYSRKYAMSRFLKELDSSVVDCEQIIDNEGLGGVGFNQDSSFPRYNKAPDFVYKANASANRANSFSSSGFRSGFNHTPSIPASVKKNDRRIVFHNPIKVDAPVTSKTPPIAHNEHSDNPYHPGARVQHVKFGIGTILRCSGSGVEARIEIRFSRDGSVRTLVAKYVKIVG